MAQPQAAPLARRAIACRRSPLITTRLALQRICSSPAFHVICSSLVVKTCSRAFVSGLTFVLMEVLVLLWKGCTEFVMAAWEWGCVFMPCSLPKQHKKTYSNKLEELL